MRELPSERHFTYRQRVRRISSIIVLLAFTTISAVSQTNSVPAPELSFLLEAAGRVEVSSTTNPTWQTAKVGLALRPGDRIRTLEQSRAAVQLSDRSVIRLSERTTLELLPPRHAEKKRFGLPRGVLYFFNREKPADVEFDTPLAAGAIRGTEFLLESLEDSLRLALIDGLVALQTGNGKVDLERGQDLRLSPGAPPAKTALLNANAAIQWALYYPVVVVPEELELSATEASTMQPVVSAYRNGDLLAALASWPQSTIPDSPGMRALQAQLELAVGRVDEAERLLAGFDSPPKRALSQLISVVKGELPNVADVESGSASERLAWTYALQARNNLDAAQQQAKAACAQAPRFGPAHERFAELEFAFGNYTKTQAELQLAVEESPRLAPARALQGFVLLEQGKAPEAQTKFEQAKALDAAFGPAWLGSGLCLMKERRFTEARAEFQAAAALEPQRALFRAYLGKAASEMGDRQAAIKEFNLAKRLDPNDPTAWLYSALHLWQYNRINEAIRDLEQAEAVNDSRAPFRSRLLLDRDRSVASADLAAIYDDAGLNDVSRHTAQRAVTEDYLNFSGHLFLANSLQAQEDVNRFDLRFETARQSELLVANLLAPPGAGNLSQQLSQQEHLRFFDPRPIGLSSVTEYDSRGNWIQAGTVFGTLDGFSYAFDSQYESLNGEQPNNDVERRQFALTLKQRVSAADEAYFQAGTLKSDAGDIASYYDPAQIKPDLRVSEKQEPTLYAGWHHTWSPGSHTLVLAARLSDRLDLNDPNGNALFLHYAGGVPRDFVYAPFTNSLDSDFTLYSVEVQQIWETPNQSLVVGGRWQSGDVDTHAVLSRELTGVVTDQTTDGSVQRGDVYGYYTRRIVGSLRLIGGVSYNYLRFPENSDWPPISSQERSRELVAPKAGLLFEPWKGGLLRASYTRSLGGLFFDNSVRLEPTQVAGFNQAFRSLIPESVAGLVPGTDFTTTSVGFDQSLSSGTWFGAEAEWLTSDGNRTVGVLTNSTFLPIPDSPSSTRQELSFHERDVVAYAGQLIGNWTSLSARYRFGDGHLVTTFPEIPGSVNGVDTLEQNNRATLHQVAFSATLNHPSGFFAQWQSAWYHQNNSGYTPPLAGADFWQHNFFAGYRFPRRYAELRLGVLNLFDTDYRLNPLTPYGDLPRSRTFTASLRLNF